MVVPEPVGIIDGDGMARVEERYGRLDVPMSNMAVT